MYHTKRKSTKQGVREWNTLEAHCEVPGGAGVRGGPRGTWRIPALTQSGKRCQIGRDHDSAYCHVHKRRKYDGIEFVEPRPRYQDYIKSHDWREKRRSYRRIMQMLDADCCALCSSVDDLELHHRTYDRLGVEDFEDLCLLCHNCHQAIHVLQKEWEYDLERALSSVRAFRAEQNA